MFATTFKHKADEASTVLAMSPMHSEEIDAVLDRYDEILEEHVGADTARHDNEQRATTYAPAQAIASLRAS